MRCRHLSRAGLFAALGAGALLIAATPAHASHRGGSGGKEPLELWRLEFGATQLNLGNASFDGSGHYAGGAPAHFNGTGSQIGALHPWMFTFGVHPTVMFMHHVTFGGLFEIGAGQSDGVQDGAARAARIGDSLTMIRGGADIGTVWAFGPVELRATVGAGVRSVSAPILSFEPTPCKGGRCYPTAAAVQPYLSPRIAIDIVGAHMFTLGAYVGVDVIPDLAVSAGAFFAIHLPGWETYARANEPPPAVEEPVPAPIPPTPIAPEVPLAESLPPIPDVPSVVLTQEPNAPVPAEPQVVVPWHVHAHVDPVGRTLTVTTPDGTVVTPLSDR